MRRRLVSSELERQFVIAFITSDEFAAVASRRLDVSLLAAHHFRVVAGWCADYFAEYNHAPKRAIESIFASWAEGGTAAKEDVAELRKVFAALADSYDAGTEINVPYLTDQLEGYLATRRVLRLKDDLEEHLHRGATGEAIDEITQFQTSRGRVSAAIDPFSGGEPWDDAFSQTTESVLHLPGDAGKFLDTAMVREGLIGIQAPEKRGKTFWCIEIAMLALRQRRRVAFVQAGDLSTAQLLRRIGMRLAGAPLYQHQCGTFRLPKTITLPDDRSQMPKVEYEEREVPVPVSAEMSKRAIQRFQRANGLKPGRPYLLISSHPTGSLNVRQLDSLLHGWRLDRDFIPDVVIVDYADILAPEDPRQQSRDAVNETWSALRRLSQEWKCLVVAPTQANARSYSQNTQTMSNFSEDKRKLAHVTGMLGLNQTASEKDMALMRLNWIVLREAPFAAQRCLYVGQCPSLGRMLCCSRYVGPYLGHVL